MLRILTIILLTLVAAVCSAGPLASGPQSAAPSAAPVPASTALVDAAMLLDGTSDAGVAAIASSAPASVSASLPPSAAPSVASAPPSEVIDAAVAVFDAMKAAKRAPTLTAIAAAIAAGVMLLISVARRFGGVLLTSGQVRVFIVFASALVGGLAQVADGMKWTEVLFVALSPVVSVGLHQIFIKPLAKSPGA